MILPTAMIWGLVFLLAFLPIAQCVIALEAGVSGRVEPDLWAAQGSGPINQPGIVLKG